MRFEDDTGTVIEGEGVGGGWADCYFAFDYFQLLLVYCDIIRLEFSQNTNIRVILRNCVIFFFLPISGVRKSVANNITRAYGICEPSRHLQPKSQHCKASRKRHC